jgi:hypothetical protein
MIVIVWVVELFDTGDLGNSELTPRKTGLVRTETSRF